jgi:hypothetical protein
MKRIYLISIFIMGLILGGCSEGTVKETSSTTIIEITQCNQYTTLESGDEVVSDQAGTILTTIFDSSNNKQICVQSGAAHIVR